MALVENPKIVTSVTISSEFHRLARENFISLSEALAKGIALMLAEKGVFDYDNKLNIVRQLSLVSQKLSETSQELNDLKDKYEEL